MECGHGRNGMWTRENGKVLAGAEKYRYNG